MMLPNFQIWLIKYHLNLIFDRWGISFYYKGDEVIWLWYWKRKGEHKHKFLNIDIWGTCSSLKEIDKFWDGYFEAGRNAKIRDEANACERLLNVTVEFLKIKEEIENAMNYSKKIT